MMALSSMELNQLKRIGSRTNGAISDALQKTLPNGWHFSLSNEIYTDNNDKHYENIGIPVDFVQNLENILPSTSSFVTSPVSSPRY